MKKSGMTARRLRGLLIVMMILAVGLGAAGFYFAQNMLGEYAVTVSQSVANSNASGGGVQSLENLQKELESKQPIITKTASLMANTQDYQSQAIKDLDIYAAAAGIGISNYSFAAAATTAAPAAATAAPAGSSITLTLTNPISYTKLLTFMKAVESNLPKMQITSVNMTRVDGDADSVRADQLIIQVYTR